MKKYFLNSREITKEEWANAFRDNPDADVILAVPVPESYKSAPPISLAKLKQIKELYKNKHELFRNTKTNPDGPS
jgi:hypothetical protein